MYFRNQGVCCDDDDLTIRFGNEFVTLQFDRETGRWLTLTDQRDGEIVMRAGDLISPILLTVGGRTQASRGFNQFFSVIDAETIGLRWRLDGYACESDAESAWL